MEVFADHCDSEACWAGLSGIDAAMVEKWNSLFRLHGPQPDTSKMKRLPVQKTKKRLIEHRQLIRKTRAELKALQPYLFKPNVFILTDHTGVALGLEGSETSISALEQHDVGTGTLFAMKHAGINAISVAMEWRRMAAIKGDEHHIKLFAGWSCICSPIYIGNRICGYLDLSFSKEENMAFAAPLLLQTVKKIEAGWKNADPPLKQIQMDEHFDRYGLSPREKQVGYGWLSNHSTLRMAESFGITEGTVRNILKKVYSKTGVNDKGQFFRKFLS